MKTIYQRNANQSLLMLIFSVCIFNLCTALATTQVTNSEETEYVEVSNCLPVTLTHSEPVPVPKNQGIQCGDNRLGEYSFSCAKHCRYSSCGRKNRCADAPIKCEKTREFCDGKNLGGMTCKKLGFFGGTLKCSTACAGFDVTSCQFCRNDLSTKCYTVNLSKELAEFSLGWGDSLPTIIPTTGGIALAWEYINSGTTRIGLVYVNRSGKIHLFDGKQMASFLGGQRPRLIEGVGRLVLVARREVKGTSEMIVQEFDFQGNAIGEMFSFPGNTASELSWHGSLLKIKVREPLGDRNWVQYLDLKQKKVVLPPDQIAESVGSKLDEPIFQNEAPAFSALATSSYLEFRFKLISGHHEFEGAFLRPSSYALPTSKSTQTFRLNAQNAKFVVAIRELKNVSY